MARSRNIKPGFFTNDRLAELPPLTRLLFAGLWVIADREGRLEDRPKRIKAHCLPYDDHDVDAALSELASGDDAFIVRYEVGGVGFIQIANWHDHQKPHHMEPSSNILPIPSEIVDDLSTTREQTVDESTTHLPTPLPRVKGISVKGIRNQESGIQPALEADDFEVQRDRFSEAWNAAAGVQPVTVFSSGRVSMLRSRLAEFVKLNAVEIPWLDALCEVIPVKFPLKFTRGDPTGWQPGVDWILKPDSLPAIIEGKYDWEKNNGRKRDTSAGQRHDPSTATRQPEFGGFR
jgi:hypothetical protein